MNKQQKGGLTTKGKFGIKLCPECGQPVKTDYYEKVGMIGGMMTSLKYGNEHMREIGKLGGRPRNG